MFLLSHEQLELKSRGGGAEIGTDDPARCEGCWRREGFLQAWNCHSLFTRNTVFVRVAGKQEVVFV